MWLEGRAWAGAKEVNGRKPGEGVAGGGRHKEGFEHPTVWPGSGKPKNTANQVGNGL